MSVERAHGSTSLIDLLDRVLDKGIVMDAWIRDGLAGIDIVTVKARIVVASTDTSLKHSDRRTPRQRPTHSVIFGSFASSLSALPTNDDDDDDDGGPDGSRSGGSSAVLNYPLERRGRPRLPRDRTRRH